MNNNQSIEELISSPDMVGFIIRQSQYLADYIANNPKIVFTVTLAGRYVFAYANIRDIDQILNDLGTNFVSARSIVLGTLDRAALEAAKITQVQQQPFLDLNGRGVLLGFVDTGIDYTLDIFRYEDGTSRIQYIYDQTISGNPTEGFLLGSEFTNEQINAALLAENPYDIVPHRDTSGHGTFLASIAAGGESEEYIGAAPLSELIVYKLRKARQYYLDNYLVPEEQEDAFESTSVMVGIEYILIKARRLGRPVVICLGLGSNFGSHDGFSIFEEYLTGVSILNGVCLCTAAGNESQTRHHMAGIVPGRGESANIDLRVGDDAGGVYISIWSGASDKFSVSVRSPTGELVGRFAALPNMRYESRLILERAVVQVEYYFPVEGSGGQCTIIKLLNATPGIWTILIYGDIVLEGSFNAWLPITGFISPEVEFLTATPYNTITIPGTMIGSLCCGAYDSSNNILYSGSSWGPTVLPIMAPDLTAPGVNVGGFYPGVFGTMTGTSVATAITSGAGALMMQWGIVDGNDTALSTYQIRAYLIRGCDRKEGISYPNPQWGYGTLNLLQTFQLMRGI
ncbi:MAG: S8 family peptidase [Eubacteriales bacterium]